MIKIALIRHSEKLSNVPHDDSPITLKGIQQSKEIGKFLTSYSFDAITSSILLRSEQTAQIIASVINKPIYPTIDFNEYYIREDRTEAETTPMLESRVMQKLYSFYGIYNSIIIVAHSSMLSTLVRNLLNIRHDDAQKFFNQFGETQIIRYDWQQGDMYWKIIDTFIPNQ